MWGLKDREEAVMLWGQWLEGPERGEEMNSEELTPMLEKLI